MLGTADPNLTNTITQVLAYWTNNVPTVIQLVIGVALLVWILQLAFNSVGITHPTDILEARREDAYINSGEFIEDNEGVMFGMSEEEREEYMDSLDYD